MIKNFLDYDLEHCWKYNKCQKIRPDLKRRVLMKLDSMDAAASIEDLRNPPGNNLHMLHGDYKNYWAISVNGPWRLIFKYDAGDIYQVRLIQYH